MTTSRTLQTGLLALILALAPGCTKSQSTPSSADNEKNELSRDEPKAEDRSEPAQAAGEPANKDEQKGEQAGEAPAVTGTPVVAIKTSMGSFKMELYADKAPKSVANFVKYVKDGQYDGTIFHRVIDGFMIQGGGFTPAFEQKATRAPIQNEADNGLKNTLGTVAMARTMDPHSASAQFFVNVADNAFLNHRDKTVQGWGYTVFGKVIDGMDVVEKIAKTPTGPKGPMPKDVPQTDIVIEKATLVEPSK